MTGARRGVDPARHPTQLLLELSGFPAPAPAVPALPRGQSAPRPARLRRSRSGDRAEPVVAGRVWGVWDGEDLVGVYATEDPAREDARTLRRRAAAAGMRAEVDCPPLPVLTVAQHDHPPRQ